MRRNCRDRGRTVWRSRSVRTTGLRLQRHNLGARVRQHNGLFHSRHQEALRPEDAPLTEPGSDRGALLTDRTVDQQIECPRVRTVKRATGLLGHGSPQNCITTMSARLRRANQPGSEIVPNSQAYAFQAGPRFRFGGQQRVTPFVQILAGVQHGSVAPANGVAPASPPDRGTAFLMSFGGGVDATLNPRFAWRAIQVEERSQFGDLGGNDQLRYRRVW